MTEPEPTNCQRCGKAVLAGVVEELWPMQLDPEEVDYADALVLHRHKITQVQLKLSTIGPSRVTYSRMFCPSTTAEQAWITVLPHLCRTYAGGRIEKIGERYAGLETV